MKTYTCTICLSLNHVARLHCFACGAIPANYSPNGKVTQVVRPEGCLVNVQVFSAFGCERQEKTRSVKVGLQTVNADYYAEGN